MELILRKANDNTNEAQLKKGGGDALDRGLPKFVLEQNQIASFE